MNYMLLVSAIITLIVAIVILIYGLKINKRKIIVVKGKYTLLLNFVAVLWLTVTLFSMQEYMQKYRWSLKSFIIIGGIIILGLILFKFSDINLNVFNSSKDSIYNTLESILTKHGVDYERKKSNIFIRNSNSFIRIWYNKPLKICTLSLLKIKFPEIITKVFEEFKNQLNNKKTDSNSTIGIIFIFLSFVVFIEGIFIFVLWVLILKQTYEYGLFL